METTQIVIYEDNLRLRQSLELLLNDSEDLEVIGGYSSCSNVLKEMELLRPQLVIMDIDMPDVNGIAGVQKIKARFPDIKVLMYTVFDDDNRIFDCICAGADGYLLKRTTPDQLIRSVRELNEGGIPVSPFVAQKLFQYFRENKAPRETFNLTGREMEILELLVKGNSYKMIAAKTGITIDTVKKHLQNIYHKLHVNCGTEAVAKALQHKIIQLD
ncbi:MAG: response regulator transcription factor [Leadbetterella sp.]|nr:response regulator transcription factor [Leadbetterella sp.]